MVHQENKDKMVFEDLPVIKDYLEIPYLSHAPLKENKGNLDLKERKEIEDIMGYLDIPERKESPAKIIMDIMESQVNQVIQEYLEWRESLATLDLRERGKPADGDINETIIHNCHIASTAIQIS